MAPRRAPPLVLLLALCCAPPARADQPSRAEWTASPHPVAPDTASALEREALAACGPADAGLTATARRVLERKLRGLPLADAEQVAALQRAAGEPHPWARAWAGSSRATDATALVSRLQEWMGGGDGRLRRCGAAEGALADGARVLVVVAVDALADLAPLAVRARTGQWLTVEARMRVPASGGRVVVLGPSGAPRPVPSWFDGAVLRARFAPDGPGELVVQVIADLPHGPRPVLEATVLVDVDAAAVEVPRAAPGEDASPAASDDDRLVAMVAAARSASGLAPLVRDPRLDAVAREHARRVALARELAHDVGDGDPADRQRAAGIDGRAAGENVAHAATVALAHRATWASPSHRANLLGRFDRIGVAVVRDGDGTVWAVEELTRCGVP